MWDHKYLGKIDFRIFPIIFILMLLSLVVIASMTATVVDGKEIFFTSYVKGQIQWFLLGWGLFFFFAGLDYSRFKEWTWILYLLLIILLLGLYLTKPIQNVHRWYRIPFVGISMQPSEYAKLVVVLSLGWFLDKKSGEITERGNFFKICCIVGVPFLLILKQPDLGTAIILYPIALVMCYFADVEKRALKIMTIIGILIFSFIILIFTDVLSYEKLKPYMTKVMKEYQYERLNSNIYHQRAAKIAISIGGIGGSGWHKSEFASKRWLPEAHTDSVFAAFAEEFGLIGVLFLLFLFYVMIYLSFQVSAEAKDGFGRLLASGIAVYLAMHIIVNIAMMCGLLPIAGVPLILISYGGNSVVTTMAALGILQSIYTRRFMF